MSAGPDTLKQSWIHWVPGVGVVRSYRRAWLRGDIVAGLVVTALLVPQGMAYAELAGLPPVTGLYTTVLALLAYAVFGPSRILVLGPDSALGPLIAATILPLVGADGDPAKAIALAGMLAILMGVVCMAAGVAHLGVLAELLSKPVRVGYINGIALVVLVSQLPKLFGFSVDADGFLPELRAWLKGVVDGDTNTTALVIGLACIVVIVGCKRWLPQVPGVLVAVVGATLAVKFFDLVDHGISVVGTVPSGFPAPQLPHVDFSEFKKLAVAAIGMAFVTLADASALSRTFAMKLRQDVDPNQEIIALGTANVAAGFFQGFPVSASSSRTAVAESNGAHTQLVGVIGAGLIVVLLVFANSIVQDLPSSALAAVVIVAGFSLFDAKAVAYLWRVRRTECLLALAATLGVVLIGVLQGIVVAIALSIAAFLHRQWRPYDAELGVVPGREGYHDLERHPEGTLVDGVAVYRFDAPVFFANAETFRRNVEAIVAGPREIHAVVIAAEPITDIDTTGADALAELLDTLEDAHVRLVFAEMKGPVKDRLRRYGLYDRIGEANFRLAVDDAVAAAAAQLPPSE
jgi:high affinity sulfate transporter 1